MTGDASTGDGSARTGPASGSSDEYAAHLERSRAVWDRWSDWYTLSERDFEPMREAAMDRLEIEPGDRVLDVGCGPGVNLERLRSDVGESGAVVALDYSPAMVEKARSRVDEHGWDNVEVRRADAATADLEGGFDAAIASLSMSVMPDVRAAVETVHDALDPGAPFVVFDIREFQDGPLQAVNPLLRRFLRWYANWNPDGDVVASLEAVFAECAVLETYTAGTTYTALCRKTE